MPPVVGKQPAARVRDATLRAAKPAEKAYRVTIGDGLYLEVAPSGSKLWRLKYRLAGKENRFAIGKYPAVLLSDAKEAARAARELIKAGIHPSHDKKLKRIEQGNEHSNSFKQVAGEWLGQKAEEWTDRTRKQRENALVRYVYPKIGALPVRQVTPAHVLDILRAVEKKAPAMAVLLNQTIGGICRYAVATLRGDIDPTNPLRGALKARQTKHHRPLTTAELPTFIAAIEDSPSYFSNKIALRLLLLTLARSVEIIGARWVEFDLEAGLWIVPAERMKMRDDHHVPLASQAVSLLQKLQPVTGHREHLFPNRDHPTKAASRGVLWKAVRHMGFDERFSPHGVRSTGSTLLNSMGYRADLIEKQLAHEERNKSRASYNRATYIEERRAMMQDWADYLDALEQGAKVIPIRSNFI